MNLSPGPKLSFLDNNGRPFVGGLLFTYVTGTSTKLATYIDESGGTPNTNPIVLDYRGECDVWLNIELTYTYVLANPGDTDPPTNPIWSVDNISALGGLNQQVIGKLLWPRTAAEIAAGAVIVSYAYPPLDLRRYGAAEEYSAIVNDLPFWETALSVIEELTNQSGVITGAVRTYRIDGTLTIAMDVGVSFGPSSNGAPTNGTVLFSETNAPILVFTTPTFTRFLSWGSISVCGTSVKAGTGSAKTSQHGVTVDNRGVWLRDMSIRACGGHSLRLLDCNGASIQNIYNSLADGSAVAIDYLSSANVGASVGSVTLINVIGAACAGDGLDIISADGRGILIGCDFEQCDGVGRNFAATAIGWEEQSGHSELNVGGSVVWAASSNHNQIDIIWGDSAGVDLDPVNNGGTGNRIMGQKFASGGGGFNTARIFPKLLDYKVATYADFATSAPNAIPFDDTPPQASGEGVTRMSLNYVPKQIGTVVRCFGEASVSISAGTHAIAALFNSAASATDAVGAGAHATPVDSMVPVPFSAEFTTTSLNSIGFDVNIGSDSAATVRFNGTTARKFGGSCVKSYIRVEEFWPL